MSSNEPKTRLSGLLQSLQVTSNQMTSCGSLPVTWCHVISCHVTATSCEWQPCRSSNIPKSRITGLLQPLPGDFRSNDVTSRSLQVREVTWHLFLSVTAASCELKLCKNSNVTKTRLIGLPQPLSGDFRSNYVTSGSLPVTWGHVTSYSVTWRPPAASYSPFKGQSTQTRLIRLLQPLPGYFRSNDLTPGSLPVTWSHVT